MYLRKKYKKPSKKAGRLPLDSHALSRAEIIEGETVLVIGGPIFHAIC